MEESSGKRKPLKKATASTNPEDVSFEKVEQENILDNSSENSRDGFKRNIGKTKETENLVKRNLSQESSEKNNNNKPSSQEIRYPNTKNVIKHKIPGL